MVVSLNSRLESDKEEEKTLLCAEVCSELVMRGVVVCSFDGPQQDLPVKRYSSQFKNNHLAEM